MGHRAVPHRPSGPAWDARCRRWRARWFAQGRACLYCGHGFRAAGLIEVAHVISWKIRPDLAEDWAGGNLAPAHGGGRSRCPVCDLACNQVSQNAPDAPRDPVTRASLPFGAQFMEMQIAERRRFLANPRNSGRKSPELPGTPPAPFRAPVGREW